MPCSSCFHVSSRNGVRVLTDGIVDDVGEVLVLPVATREAHEGETGRQKSPVGEVVHGRHELLARQIACHAEDHQRAGTGDAVEAAVIGIAQRIVVARDLGSHRERLLLVALLRGLEQESTST
jgi:hypothetical protein